MEQGPVLFEMNGKTKFLQIIFFLFISLLCTAAENYISAPAAAQKLKLELWWEPLSEELVFKKNDLEASCKIGRDLMVFGNSSADFAAAPYKKDGLTYISSEMYQKLETFFTVPKNEQKYSVGVILIDPGHGGKDPGTVGSYTENGKTVIVKEKDIALKVSLDLYAMLKKAYPGKKILLTRNKDVYPTLEDRVNMANAVKLKDKESILYVSIHVNASLNTRASGFEVWYLPPEYRRQVLADHEAPKEIHSILNSMMEEEYTTESILMAKNILDGLDSQIGAQSRNRGIRENQWFVVRGVSMPSVLIELGFISNKSEIKLLNSPAYLKKCTLGIYNGLSAFIADFENTGETKI